MRQKTAAVIPGTVPAAPAGWVLSPRIILGCIVIVWILFIALNLRHLFEPFRDYGKPLAGEPYYAIRSLNYLRHGCFTHWLGVCDNLNPHPETLQFKFTEMPAFFVVNSLVFRLAGVSSNNFRMVELIYAFGLMAFLSFAAWKLYDPKSALTVSLIFLLLPVNVFLLYISWAFLFPMLALFFYVIWLKERCRISYSLMITAALIGCLHHISGFFVAPALLVHAALTRSLKENKKALIGVFSLTALAGLAYVGQLFLLRQNIEAVSAKAVSESVFNLRYLLDFFSLNIQKLEANYFELLTPPLLALALWWIASNLKKKERLPEEDHFLVALLLFFLLFFLVFLGMAASHLHFLTLLGPFLALAATRALMQFRSRKLRTAATAALIAYLVVACYKVQAKYDLLFWNKGNERGYALAKTLQEMTGETDAVAGVPGAGYGFHALSPAFHFYLQRDYYGRITTLEQMTAIITAREPAFFLLPSSANGFHIEPALKERLFSRYSFFIEPDRKDVLIFDLRGQKNAQKGEGDYFR